MKEFVFTVTLQAPVDINPKTIEEMEDGMKRRIEKGGFFHDVQVEYSHQVDSFEEI